MRLYCSNGHLVTPRRTYVNGVTGEVRCKTCKRDAMRACRWRASRARAQEWLSAEGHVELVEAARRVDWWESRRYAERD